MGRGIGAGSNGNGNTPLTIGGSLSVRDSTELAALDPFGLPIGTRVFHQSLLDDFELVLSNAALITDQIIAVFGVNGCRWVRVNGGSGDFAGYSVQYADPNGNNSADGTVNAPKKTASAAILALANGGTVYVSPNTVFSDGTEGYGLVAGQGYWTTDLVNKPAGFLAAKELTICGIGGSSYPLGTPSFCAPVAYLPWGAQDGVNRFNPAVWRTNSAGSIKFKDCFFYSNTPLKLGVDHRRNLDTTPAYGNITSATRTGGRTTITVTPPPGYPLIDFARTAGVVTAHITCCDTPPLYGGGNNQAMTIAGTTNPFLINGAFLLSDWAHLTTNTGLITYTDDTTYTGSASDNVVAGTKTLTVSEIDFTGRVGAQVTIRGSLSGNNGTYTVTSVSSAHVVVCSGAVFAGNETFTGGASFILRLPDKTTTAVSAGAIQGHFVPNPNLYFFPLSSIDYNSGLKGYFFELVSTDPNFPSTYYQIIQTTPTTISYLDPYGADHTSSNIGQYLTEIRDYTDSDLDFWENCYFQQTGTGGQNFGSGPTINRGTCFFVGQYKGGGASGLSPDTVSDPNRRAIMLMAGGVLWGASVVWRDFFTTTGGIRGFGGSPPCTVKLDYVLADPAGLGADPLVHLVMGGFAVSANDCAIFDVDPNVTPTIDLGHSYGPVTTTNTIVRNGATAGGRFAIPDGAIQRSVDTDPTDWRTAAVSQDARGYAGVWANDGRIAGKRSDAQSQFGVIQNLGLTNRVNENVSAWTTLNGTPIVTGGQPDPMGGTTGYTVTGTGDLYSEATVTALVAGDVVTWSAWYRSNSGILNSGGNIGYMEAVGVTYPDNIMLSTFTTFGGQTGDWQELRWTTTVSAFAAGATKVRFHLFASVSPYVVAMQTGYVLPLSAMSNNESARNFLMHRHVPSYLAARQAGTYTGVPLFGGGGFGIPTGVEKVVGGASGQLTLTGGTVKYVPVIVGGVTMWLASVTATVNP